MIPTRDQLNLCQMLEVTNRNNKVILVIESSRTSRAHKGIRAPMHLHSVCNSLFMLFIVQMKETCLM